MQFELTNEKEIGNFIKVIYEINQIMKNIYSEEVNFSPNYLFRIYNDECEIIYANMDCLPLVLSLKINDDLFNKIPSIIKENTFETIIDSSILFQALKDKSSITKISFINNNIFALFNITDEENNKTIIEKQINTSYKDEKFHNMIKSCLGQIYNDVINRIHDKIYTLEEVNPDVINNIKESKDLLLYTLNLSTNTFDKSEKVIINGNDDYIPILMNKKFLNGIYYKIKKLKKGDVLEYSKISIELYESMNNIFIIKFLVNTKIGIAEHIFMISEF